jgi:hypothetical protein
MVALEAIATLVQARRGPAHLVRIVVIRVRTLQAAVAEPSTEAPSRFRDRTTRGQLPPKDRTLLLLRVLSVLGRASDLWLLWRVPHRGRAVGTDGAWARRGDRPHWSRRRS